MVIYENDRFKIHQLILNEIKTNCFIIQKEKLALLIDPTNQSNVIIEYLQLHQLELKYMIATHGHFDHISGAAGIIENTSVKVLFVNENDFSEVKRGQLYSNLVFKRAMQIPRVEMFNKEILTFLNSWGLRLDHAGGHTKGSCFLYDANREFIITGDLALHHKLHITLFNAQENIKELSLFIEMLRSTFPSHAIIFPGHGNRTSVGEELKKNKKWAYVENKFLKEML